MIGFDNPSQKVTGIEHSIIDLFLDFCKMLDIDNYSEKFVRFR